MVPEYKPLYWSLDEQGKEVAYCQAETLEEEIVEASKNKWIENWEDLRERRIAFQEEITKGIWVSAIFLGVSVGGSGCWETVVFGGKLNGQNALSRTREEAVEVAQKFVVGVKNAEGLAKIETLKKKRRSSSWAF